MCELLDLPPVCSMGWPVRFSLTPSSPGRWRLYLAPGLFREAGPGEPILWSFAAEGIFCVEARLLTEEGEKPCDSRQITVVATIQWELWRSILVEHRIDCRRWQDDLRCRWPHGPDAFDAERQRQRGLQRELWQTVRDERLASCTDRQNTLRAEWPDTPAAFEAELVRQRQCRDVVFSAVVDADRERRYLRSSPLTWIRNPQERPPILQEACYRAIAAGFRLDPPTEVSFEQWFSRIRERAVLDSLAQSREEAVAVAGLEYLPAPEVSQPEQPLFRDLKLFRDALAARGEPGPELADAVFDGANRELTLEPEDRNALWEFLYGLNHIRAGPLPLRLYAFGQSRHLRRLAANSPWYAPARECLLLMERLAGTTAGAPRVQAVGQRLHAFAEVRVQYGDPVNPGCGPLFGRFLEHLNALRTLGPCWRLAEHCDAGALWPCQQGLLQQFRAFLGQGTWRDHFEGTAPTTLNGYFRAWREMLSTPSSDLATPDGVRLLLLWMHLRLDEYQVWRNARERRIASLDEAWWQSQLTGQYHPEAARAVFAVYHEFLEPCALPEENQPCPMNVEL